jgi:hypothetical protein
MKIAYVATDLEFDSTNDLSHIVEELGDNVSVHLNEWVGDVYRVALGVGHCDTHADEAVAFYCSLLESLSDPAKISWDRCTRRVLDIAFESGTDPKSESYEIPAELVRRVSDLGMSIAVTIYRAGSYSDTSKE